MTPRRPAIIQNQLRYQAQTAFLAEYERLGTVSAAAREIGIDRQTHYDWLSSDETYPDRWRGAQEGSTQTLEEVALARATKGQCVGVWFQGVRVGEEFRGSDQLLMFLLKSRRPDVYRDRYEVSGPGGGPIEVQAVRQDVLSRLTQEELEALMRINRGLTARSQAVETEGSQCDGEGQLVETQDQVPAPAGAGPGLVAETGEGELEPGEGEPE